MAKSILVNEETVNEILKRLNILAEETNIVLSQANRAVENAELQGWNDLNYVTFKDNFENAERKIKEGVKEIEEVLTPELKKILASIESF